MKAPTAATLKKKQMNNFGQCLEIYQKANLQYVSDRNNILESEEIVFGQLCSLWELWKLTEKIGPFGKTKANISIKALMKMNEKKQLE